MNFRKYVLTIVIALLIIISIPCIANATDYVVCLDAGHSNSSNFQEDIKWFEEVNGDKWDNGKYGTNPDYDNEVNGIIKTTESALTKETVIYMMEYLKQYDNIKVVLSPRTGEGYRNERPLYGKNKGANVHVSVHYDAPEDGGKSKGALSIYKPGDEISKKFAEKVLDSVVARTKLNNRGTKSDDRDLGILNNSSQMNGAPSIVLECACFDNTEDLAFISEKSNLKKIAAGAVSGILSYLGVEDKGYPDISDYNGYSGSSSSSGGNIISNEKKFLGLWKNSTGIYEPYYKRDGKTINEKALYDKNGTEVIYSANTASVAGNIIGASKWFFELLELSERTQNHLTIMKYLMNVYTDSNEYGDLTFEKDIASLFKGGTGFKKSTNGSVSYESLNLTSEDIEILYKITFAERGNGTQQQQEYVASVILNRVLSSKFPNTVKDVVFAPNQFEPVSNGQYDKAVPTQTTKDAVDNVVKNGDKSKMAIYFMTPNAAKGQEWIKNTIYLFNDTDEKLKDGDDGSHNFYTTEDAKNELKQYVKAGATMEGWSTQGVSCPRWYQGDERWASYPYNNANSGTIGGGGCGACALAMAVSGLTQQEVTPIDIAEFLNSNGTGTVTNGEESSKLVANKYGLTYEFIDRSNKTAIDAALDAGKCCIFSIDSNGIYTGGGHFIMCNGRDESGYYVLESGHFYETDTPYTYNQVFSQGVQGVFVLGN